MIQHLRWTKTLIDPIHLGLTALVAPDERRTDDVLVAIENHQPVHLPGKSDATDLMARNSGRRQRSANRFESRFGPVFRPLLGPQRLLHHHLFVRNGHCGDFPSHRVKQDRA
jgi:hypothetical protein